MHGRHLLAAAAALMLVGCGNSSEDRAEAPAGQARQDAGVRQGPPAAFAVCASCHSVRPGGRASGPSLAGVWGRKAGTLPGYPFSAPLRASGLVWDRATLDTWLAAPMKAVPGTRMVVGMPDPAARKAVIDYLETLR